MISYSEFALSENTTNPNLAAVALEASQVASSKHVAAVAPIHSEKRMDRFWKYVDKNGPVPKHDSTLGPCWIWLGGKVNGYGRFSLGGQKDGGAFAHRVSYQWVFGIIPDGKILDHLCRNTSCVNPAHLEPVSHRVNTMRGRLPTVLAHLNGLCMKGHSLTRENSYFIHERGKLVRRCRTCNLASSNAFQKGRYKKVENKKSRGSTHRSAKLTEAQVLEIRRLKKEEGLSHRELAKRFGIARGGISLMVNRKTWRHI